MKHNRRRTHKATGAVEPLAHPSRFPHDLRSVDFRFDSPQYIWTNHDCNSHHPPRPSFLDIQDALADTPPCIGRRLFLWDQALAKVRKIFPHWDKRGTLCGMQGQEGHFAWTSGDTKEMFHAERISFALSACI